MPSGEASGAGEGFPISSSAFGGGSSQKVRQSREGNADMFWALYGRP